jgi:DNA-binding transcriptional regulator YhcF (GntR family)
MSTVKISEYTGNISGFSGSLNHLMVDGDISVRGIITASQIYVNAETLYIGNQSLSSIDVVNLKSSRNEFIESKTDIAVLKAQAFFTSSNDFITQLDSLGYKREDCCEDFRNYTQSANLRFNAANNYATSLSSSHDALENIVENLLSITSSFLTVTPSFQQVTSIGGTTTSSLTTANTTVSGNLLINNYSSYSGTSLGNNGALKVKGISVFESGLDEEIKLAGNSSNPLNTGYYGGVAYFYKKRDDLDAYFMLGGSGVAGFSSNPNSGFYTTTLVGCTDFPVLPWDRKINNFFIKNNITSGTSVFPSSNEMGVRHSIFMPPILNAGYSAGEIIQVYNMTSGSVAGGIYSPTVMNSGSIYLNAFSNAVTSVDVENKLITGIGNQNQGIYSGSWNSYTNIVWEGTGPFYNMDKSIEVPPGHKAIFEVFHYGTPSSYYDITHPHPNNIAQQYGYSTNGYSTSVTSGIGVETSKVYRLIRIESL